MWLKWGVLIMDDSNQIDVAEVLDRATNVTTAELYAEAHTGPSDLGVGVWETYYLKQAGARAFSRRIAFLAHDLSDFDGVEKAASRLIVDVYRSNYLRSAMWDIMQTPTSWVAVVMCYSDFGSVSQTFNIMRSFRLRCPSVPFILASRELSADDLTQERLPLCDVSLKLPVDMQNFSDVLNQATVNNHAWNSRNELLRLGLL